MKIIRRPAVQGHEIPQTAHQPKGPFPAELFHSNPIESVEPDDADPWANAQNDYTSPTWLRCRACGDVMTESEADTHECGDGKE